MIVGVDRLARRETKPPKDKPKVFASADKIVSR